MKTWFMMLISIFLVSCGQLLIKFGLNSSRTDGLSSLTYIYTVIGSPYIIIGLLSYGLSVIFWFLALRQAPLSQLYPVVSISYILVTAGSAVFLDETLSPMRVVGIGIIMIGVTILVSS